ncbi:zf-DNL-domain-containing protein [Lentithecium fluviatile CBS 122367]|uniref:Zf-DNL-domain-containing protein n=1 Tax=Lentithecium fluviatile CBS 122367 TaxID=1168545 RepID=A0A6G1JBY4_9PLEO|nr:zf-DNL-domain-containing protein [Lentithecium fluviatile CBS 122367]
MRPASSSILGSLVRSSAPRVRPSPPPCIPAPKRLFHPSRTSILARPSPILARSQALCAQLRHESTTSAPDPPSTSTTPPDSRLERDQVPAYELTFTCKVCSTRSSHRLSKQGYHHGTILISCPGCKNRHLISDHLKIFSDKRVTVEDILREKGDLVKRGELGTEGDIEFWEDGTTTPRSAQFHANSTTQSDSTTSSKPLTERPSPEKTP